MYDDDDVVERARKLLERSRVAIEDSRTTRMAVRRLREALALKRQALASERIARRALLSELKDQQQKTKLPMLGDQLAE